MYSYNSTFHSYTLDATLVIAVTYLFSAIAVVILPWRKPDLWARVAGQPDQGARRPDRAAGRGGSRSGCWGFNLYEWLTNDNYFVNNADSLIYMAAMYVLAIVVFVVRPARSAGARASTSA